MQMSDNYKGTLNTIGFINEKIEVIKKENKNKMNLEIKDISDLQRYSETLVSLSKYALNMKELMENG